MEHPVDPDVPHVPALSAEKRAVFEARDRPPFRRRGARKGRQGRSKDNRAMGPDSQPRAVAIIGAGAIARTVGERLAAGAIPGLCLLRVSDPRVPRMTYRAPSSPKRSPAEGPSSSKPQAIRQCATSARTSSPPAPISSVCLSGRSPTRRCGRGFQKLPRAGGSRLIVPSGSSHRRARSAARGGRSRSRRGGDRAAEAAPGTPSRSRGSRADRSTRRLRRCRLGCRRRLPEDDERRCGRGARRARLRAHPGRRRRRSEPRCESRSLDRARQLRHPHASARQRRKREPSDLGDRRLQRHRHTTLGSSTRLS